MAFPVVACTTPSGGSLGSQGWKPTVLLAPIPTTLVGTVEFYSDGVHTVLGPTGWSCAQTPGNLGATGLAVYPPGVPDPSALGVPPAGAEGIFATFDTTGHARGIALVCPFFTLLKWQQAEANCNGLKPTGEQSSLPTPDIASVTDPAGVAGTPRGIGRSPSGDRNRDLPPGAAGRHLRVQCEHCGGVLLAHRCLTLSDHPLRLRGEGVPDTGVRRPVVRDPATAIVGAYRSLRGSTCTPWAIIDADSDRTV